MYVLSVCVYVMYFMCVCVLGVCVMYFKHVMYVFNVRVCVVCYVGCACMYVGLYDMSHMRVRYACYVCYVRMCVFNVCYVCMCCMYVMYECVCM